MVENTTIITLADCKDDEARTLFEQSWSEDQNKLGNTALYLDGTEWSVEGIGHDVFVNKEGEKFGYSGIALRGSDGVRHIASLKMFTASKAVTDCLTGQVVDPSTFAFSKNILAAINGKNAVDSDKAVRDLVGAKKLRVARHGVNTRYSIVGRPRLIFIVEFVL